MAQKIGGFSLLALVIFAICFWAPYINGKAPESNFGAKAYTPEIVNTITTTNAVPTNIVTLPLNSGQTIRLTVDVVGMFGNDRCRGRKTAIVKNIGGVLSIVGSAAEDIIEPAADPGLFMASFDILTSGTNVVVPVTGVAGTVVWIANTTYIIN